MSLVRSRDSVQPDRDKAHDAASGHEVVVERTREPYEPVTGQQKFICVYTGEECINEGGFRQNFLSVTVNVEN